MFQRQRAKEFLKPLFAVTDPAKAGDLVRQYRGYIFPEDRFDDLKYYKAAAKMFDKMRKINMTARVV